MGYSTEKAIAKCRKRSGKKSDDVGEDALVQMVKAKRKKQKQVDTKGGNRQ